MGHGLALMPLYQDITATSLLIVVGIVESGRCREPSKDRETNAASGVRVPSLRYVNRVNDTTVNWNKISYQSFSCRSVLSKYYMMYMCNKQHLHMDSHLFSRNILTTAKELCFIILHTSFLIVFSLCHIFPDGESIIILQCMWPLNSTQGSASDMWRNLTSGTELFTGQ